MKTVALPSPNVARIDRFGGPRAWRPASPIAAAADDERQIGSNRAAEAVRSELEAGRVREREAHRTRVRVDLVAAAVHEGARVLDAAAHRLDGQAIARHIVEARCRH